MVGFCDLVGVDIAPVSKKTAVKYIETYLKNKDLIEKWFGADLISLISWTKVTCSLLHENL